ncbi:uncharacterized protein LAJ45_08403 [Morchella importuna]|uniref:uncharacterized protein n=1 Tax=Morchella importuna TaxID=1174673 RepID=UPI001E8E46D6|nr:uncharacterized protein LAJ45_08403 [Morchella importuna]KAH8147576.1 hypothetical protein LAJ45_08403 [Morchella importuna]
MEGPYILALLQKKELSSFPAFLNGNSHEQSLLPFIHRLTYSHLLRKVPPPFDPRSLRTLVIASTTHDANRTFAS